MIILHHSKDKSGVSRYWKLWNGHFTKGVADHGIDNFLQWTFIKNSMFHHVRKIAVNKLVKGPRWEYFKTATKEDKFGNPDRHKDYPQSSGNLLHHAYSLDEFLDFSQGTDLSQINSIYEFGGGYGSLCRLIFRLGFSGIYSIFDFPIVCFLQRQFLSNIGINQGISDVTSDKYQPEVDLFIALWSLSECPIKFRRLVLKRIKFKRCLIAFQGKFFSYNNYRFFRAWIKTKKEFRWSLFSIKHLPGNFYLMGEIKEKDNG